MTGPVNLICLEGVVVLGCDGLYVYRDKVVYNSMQSIAPWRAESLIAQENDHGSLVLKQAIELPAPVTTPLMMGFVGAWPNYAHWITECLPRAVGFLALRQHEPEAKLLLPPLPEDSPQLAIIRRLGIGPDATVMARGDEVIHVRRFWAMDGVDIWLPPTLCRAAALRLSMAVPLDQREAEGSLPERLYIRRGMPLRRLVNFDQIKPVIDRFDFTVVRMQDLSADDQIRALRNARFVVGENSGGLANIMFCRRGARVLELNNPAFPQPAHWALTGLIGADYGYCVGQHVGLEPPNMNSNYAILPERFARAMEALMADDSPLQPGHPRSLGSCPAHRRRRMLDDSGDVLTAAMKMRNRYLNLLEASLTGTLLGDAGIDPFSGGKYDPNNRTLGRDWPGLAQTMIGSVRMRNLRHLCETAILNDIPGDFIETGVWRGGACIFMRGMLAAYGDTQRRVFVADSFSGLPPPSPEIYAADAGDPLHTYKELAVSRKEVEENFRKYALLDERVVFLEGWFKDTLPVAPIQKLAILRLDGDMYESTIQALDALYHKVSYGGFVIVDDYFLAPCAQAVDGFRARAGITSPLIPIDGWAVWWRVDQAR
jgi:O-methyltransferase/8-demethyl-8-(2,3-dimethoxy-alpha-L-rhamnosyl)tetracenomycin-C 4'-O-methyltransferase